MFYWYRAQQIQNFLGLGRLDGSVEWKEFGKCMEVNIYVKIDGFLFFLIFKKNIIIFLSAIRKCKNWVSIMEIYFIKNK